MRNNGRSLEVSPAVHCLWRERAALEAYSTAVSLHSHTLHSREGLEFIPRVLNRVPVAGAALARMENWHRRETGKPIPFERAYWRPPLHPHAAFDLETAQIRESLGRESMVSITDHDNIEACAELRAIGIGVPYSVEWTVPYFGTVFHIGVHNLPEEEARSFEAAMAEVTADPQPARIGAVLAELQAYPDVLLVLNHPFSCEGRMDGAAHRKLLIQFLNLFGGTLHALELNGLQPVGNNIETIRLAAERAFPVISGGDRHCLEPNANLNLTNARTFAEFVQEVRVEQRSTVLFMPQYRDPIAARYIEFIWHAVRNYPDLQGRERWVDRVYVNRENGCLETCAQVWPNGGPAPIRGFISLVAFLASPWMRALLCRAIGRVATVEAEAL